MDYDRWTVEMSDNESTVNSAIGTTWWRKGLENNE